MFKFDVNTGEIFIYDAIGDSSWGMIDAASVIDALGQIGNKKAIVRLNSPGGSVDEGIAIHSALERHKPGVEVIVDSLAASIASVIMLASDTRIVVENGMVMTHNASTIAWGDSRELRRWADVLDKYGERIVKTYAKKTGKTEQQIRQWMDDETWMTADEAVANGFATAIQGSGDDPIVPKGLFNHAPKALERPVAAGSRNYAANRTAAEIRLAMTRQRNKNLDVS